MKHLQSFEAAANYLGIDPNALPDVHGLTEKHQAATVATYKLFIISEAAWKTEGKVIDWANWNQRKYYPFFNMSPSGFSYLGYDYDGTHSDVSSRLVYPSKEIARYVGETYLELYRDLMVIQ